MTHLKERLKFRFRTIVSDQLSGYKPNEKSDIVHTTVLICFGNHECFVFKSKQLFFSLSLFLFFFFKDVAGWKRCHSLYITEIIILAVF